MISNLSSDYRSICELFNFSKESASDINKKILIELAKNGGAKPKSPTKEGRTLNYYTNKSSNSYDESFDELIRKLRPDWFVKPSDTMRQIIIKMAKDGKPKPKKSTKEGRKLSYYTSKSSHSYYEPFDKLIRKLRPDWFVSSSDLMKKILIKMAKKGKPRPKQKTKEGMSLCIYTNKFSQSYDENFDKLIKKLRPDWFIKSSDVTRQILVKMAKERKPKPKAKTKEGKALVCYTNKSTGSYNESFDKLIRKLRPDWFIKYGDIMKQKLINMAKERKPKPKAKTKEGSALYGYTNKSTSYNKSFDKLIRKLRPDWFVSSSDLMKKILIKMAKEGKPRPKQKTKEANALCRYTTKGTSYDESFDKLIRKLRPDWFKK